MRRAGGAFALRRFPDVVVNPSLGGEVRQDVEEHVPIEALCVDLSPGKHFCHRARQVLVESYDYAGRAVAEPLYPHVVD